MTSQRVSALVLVMALAYLARADWPMPGHDAARSSWASQEVVERNLRPIWHRKIGPYIPSKVQIVTVAAAGRVPALVLGDARQAPRAELLRGRLHRLSGIGEARRPPSENVRLWLRQTQDRRVAMPAMDPRDVYTTEAGGFLYLVPEFGEYLHQHARQGVAKHVGDYNDLAPMWFLSEADEVSRAVARKGCPEGSLSQLYDYASLFAAKAYALKEGRQELERYLDVPGVWRGDLFYVQNPVATIEARR